MTWLGDKLNHLLTTEIPGQVAICGVTFVAENDGSNVAVMLGHSLCSPYLSAEATTALGIAGPKQRALYRLDGSAVATNGVMPSMSLVVVAKTDDHQADKPISRINKMGAISGGH